MILLTITTTGCDTRRVMDIIAKGNAISNAIPAGSIRVGPPGRSESVDEIRIGKGK